MPLEVVPDAPRHSRIIRQMQFTDLEAVAAIERRTFTLPWSLGIFSGQLARESGICLVCEIDGHVAAYLMADMFVDVWHLMNVAVDGPYRRAHVASALIEAYFALTDVRVTAGTPWRCAPPTRPPSSSTAASGSWLPGRGPATTATTAKMPSSCGRTGRGTRHERPRPGRRGSAGRPILCIETSCDDTSAAVVDGREVLASIVSSQNELHAQFGGVVPEVASRRHTELVNEVVAEAMAVAGARWHDLAAVAGTQGPGLIGALLVGLAAAKAIAHRRRLPFIPVNHLEGHIAANYALGVEAPFVCLVASGGHTMLAVVEDGVRYRVAARTLDDAAGEAFDKGARLLGLGYPGGKELDALAARGDAGYAAFPRAVPRGRDFSFSGLKTALLYDLRERPPAEVEAHRADIAASYQAAIVRQLVDKTAACAAAEGLRSSSHRRRRRRQLRPAPGADRALRR